MKLKPLHNSADGQMRVIGLMSGNGTNLVKIIEHEKELDYIKMKQENLLSPYKVVAIFSDTFDSNATKIGKDFDIPVITRDIEAWYSARGKEKKDLSIRPEFDAETVKILSYFKATAAAYAGYMSIATNPLINAFLGINVHPADLSILDKNGNRKYTGDNAVYDAMEQGETYISSTTHIIESEVDEGRILMISKPLKIEEDCSDLFCQAKENQEKLKEQGDWIIFPKTLELIATGRYAQDEQGKLYFDGKPIPNGIRYTDSI